MVALVAGSRRRVVVALLFRRSRDRGDACAWGSCRQNTVETVVPKKTLFFLSGSRVDPVRRGLPSTHRVTVVRKVRPELLVVVDEGALLLSPAELLVPVNESHTSRTPMNTSRYCSMYA